MFLYMTLLSFLLSGCYSNISLSDAEEIALQTAIDEGYSNPTLFSEVETIEKYHYSKKENKDVKVWEVNIVTDERPREIGLPADLIYYVNVKNGEVVHKISGLGY